jgi:hypothetical protein
MTKPTSREKGIEPARPLELVRCPVQVVSARHEGKIIRCVRDDLHSGRCADIGGHDLTANAVPPWDRYTLMDLSVPARVSAVLSAQLAADLKRRVIATAWPAPGPSARLSARVADSLDARFVLFAIAFVVGFAIWLVRTWGH